MSLQALESMRIALRRYEADILALKYFASRPDHLAAIALSLNCLELAHSISGLANIQAKAGIPVLLRSLMECAIRVAYLGDSPATNAASLELIDNLERIRLLKNYKPASSMIQDFEARNKILRTRGAKAHDFRQMLEQLGADDWYMLFAALSNHTHGNLTSMTQQFFEHTPNGARIEYNKPSSPEALAMYYSACEQLLGICHKATMQILEKNA
jgi:hypothetical protein